MLYSGDTKRDTGPLSWAAFGRSVALHIGIFLFFWIMAKLAFPKPETLIPIDMTVVPPWAEQTDDPDPDPNPPPKPQPEVKPPPKPPAPEPEVKQPPKPVEAVEKVVEKKKEKPKEKPKPLDLKSKAKLVKTPVEQPKPVDLREKAKRIEPPPNIKAVGKGTAADKPLSPEEFLRKMNEGYRIGARNQVATSEAQRCVSVIAQAIRREWDKESFKWFPGLQPLQVELKLGPGGAVQGYRILVGSGDPDVDRTAQNALSRLRTIPGLSATFLQQFPVLAILMEPTQM